MTEFVKLDSFDRKLIARARANNLEPARITAETVGLSESAVLRRMRRLRAEGVIVRDIAVVDPARIAPHIVIHVLVKMMSQDREAGRAFKAAMRASPEVQAAWDVTGEWSYLLNVAVRTMEEYEAFGERELTDAAHIQTFQSMITIREVVAFDPSRAPMAD
ncbi:MAG TPA: Lrp/AsnC family transcriptional regulator [Brevundimonas sp.]|jgi:Lrp/AsnC family leucine-responsive transcriptional regulator|uniref:Lrp/AsnC family transcriptional regulator n=1 Tax=Brevundimonas sp. TaxID=1871086 RepID=UPI002B619915|nr:Lrp/AsnC family transcriptional regulator [Brevundimonas sp.]HRH20887.1 Lrp/AsnC family transcriptional regulator [Brevundimonas sp.]